LDAKRRLGKKRWLLGKTVDREWFARCARWIVDRFSPALAGGLFWPEHLKRPT
jgi:hypothetical protein